MRLSMWYVFWSIIWTHKAHQSYKTVLPKTVSLFLISIFNERKRIFLLTFIIARKPGPIIEYCFCLNKLGQLANVFIYLIFFDAEKSTET